MNFVEIGEYAICITDLGRMDAPVQGTDQPVPEYPNGTER